MPSDPATGYHAHYNDGQSAASLAVFVHVGEPGLVVAGAEGSVLDRWDWDDVMIFEPVRASRPIRLSNRARAGARLTIEDPAAIVALRAHARYLTREPFDRGRIYRVAGIAGACVAAVLFFAYGLPWIARPAASLVPVSWEEPVGESTVNLVNQLFAKGRPLCGDEAGAAALQKLTRKLGDTIDTPYTIRVDVADSDLVNALAAPGGRIILFRGLIDKASAPDEVAGVLAHEMAHVHHRHPTLGMINTIGWSAMMSAFTGGASLSSAAVARLAAHLATSAYTRDLEAEADAGATAMLNASGIGSAGLAAFFRSIQERESEGLSLPAYLSTHPETGERIAAIEAKQSRAAAPALSDSDWKALKAICRGTDG